jgi:hypothetical protein
MHNSHNYFFVFNLNGLFNINNSAGGVGRPSLPKLPNVGKMGKIGNLGTPLLGGRGVWWTTHPHRWGDGFATVQNTRMGGSAKFFW